ncbi:hypothetical protein B0T26DRAFT_725772 [Lasiosphaeria miniovina]|uniref:Uncharacterized protein n=1 Tax=Lasiosphaeria miniovina TaxID=1954250 RepID=A0AA39ZYX9_9PEZI|nr:uncharacterized protein B0T26DRAFT_725772 [Lasiosphaeria miniovina]KAK0706212.1 hypothetical protein B0T26DRAFT_725772 [Lasiosphaeria miniovina]
MVQKDYICRLNSHHSTSKILFCLTTHPLKPYLANKLNSSASLPSYYPFRAEQSTMASRVYWTTTAPFTVIVAGVPTQFVYLRFGITTIAVADRVNQWKNYCPLPVVLGGSVLSQANIGGNDADNAIRRYAIVPPPISSLDFLTKVYLPRLLINPALVNPPNPGLAWTLSQPATQIDWFVVPVIQPGGATVGNLVQASVNATINAGGLSAANIDAFVTHMYNNINH